MYLAVFTSSGAYAKKVDDLDDYRAVDFITTYVMEGTPVTIFEDLEDLEDWQNNVINVSGIEVV